MTNTSDQAGLTRPFSPNGRQRYGYDPTASRGKGAFLAARRHSRRVRLLKYVLPALALAGVGLFWGTTRFIPADLAKIVSLASVDIESKSVVMDKPQISGFEGTKRAYEVKAESAVQSLDDPKVMTFNDIDARIGLDAAGTATVDAPIGVYDGNRNTLTLKDGVAIKTTSGYWASFREAAIDLSKGNLVSTQPIEIRTNEGSIRANGVKVSERGRRIAFVDGVTVTYLPRGTLMATPEEQ